MTMVLVFGGTTEGRKAVEVLEEAGTPYYYSTRSDGQQVELVHGIHLTGDMDVPKMVACCREHGIRLIVDAAHPFAEELHRNLLFVARHIGAAIIRYDRIYPPRDETLVWCRDYQDAMQKLEAEGIDRLLALTGVNNIGTLRPYWERHECWFRILNRRLSLLLAQKAGFPEDHLVYYEKRQEGEHSSEMEDETQTLIAQLQPQAILTKESGLSGGFCEKVEAAKRAGIKVFVIERPLYPPHTPNPQHVPIEYVNGPHGLRRAVEHLLPPFYPLHSGLTTGTCATAAAVAAARRLLCGETPSEVPVILPNGETIRVPVGYAVGYAFCIKEAGDDPDVTNGLEIRASVKQADAFEILGGEGVGRFTLPGFDFPPGEPAINKAPREMIRQNLEQLSTLNSPLGAKRRSTLGELVNLSTCQLVNFQLSTTISVPEGREIARRTFNPRLGIEGGISIIGVSGIVKPFSEEAFIDSIHKCMEVAWASGSDRVVIHSGAKSAGFLQRHYPDLPQQAFVEYGNYIGETLKMAADLGIPRVTLGIMLDKAVKLAAGQLDTHSRRTTMDKDFIRQMLVESGCDVDIKDITLARELWAMLPPGKVNAFAATVIRHCSIHCRPLLPNGLLTILLIDDEGHVWPASAT